jgi:hypothetical protein
MENLLSPYTLGRVASSDLQKLCEVLWGWQLCHGCKSGQQCASLECPWQRSRRLALFFDYYRDVTMSYVPELLPGNHAALRTHNDVFDIIQIIKAWPDLPRSQLTKEYFSSRDNGQSPLPPLTDQNRAFNLAVRIMTMVNCSANHQQSDVLELGRQPVIWRNDMSMSQFLHEAFPKTDHPSLTENDRAGNLPDIKVPLAAKRLKKLGLRFQTTDDPRNHLKLDHRSGTVEIYHHTAYLKEHLIATRSVPRPLSLEDSIKM